jgi:hypothetical protein
MANIGHSFEPILGRVESLGKDWFNAKDDGICRPFSNS